MNIPVTLRRAATALVAALTIATAAACEVPYTRQTTHYGPAPAQVMDLYLPKTAGPHPVILYLHMGGWVSGDRTQIPEAIKDQTTRGWAVVSIDYSLAPAARFPAPLHDTKRAIRYVKAHAAEWNLNPNRVVISGASAGGHLAALAAATAGIMEPTGLPAELANVDSRVAGLIDIVGPSDMSRFGETPYGAQLSSELLGCRTEPGHPQRCSDQLLRQASPQSWLDATDPPALFLYGQLDTLVRPDVDGGPLAHAWSTARGGRVGYAMIIGQGHNLDKSAVIGHINHWLDFQFV